MSQKDYQSIATIIATQVDRERDHERFVIVKIATDLAAIFKQDNPRFDRDRFYRACHLDHLVAN